MPEADNNIQIENGQSGSTQAEPTPTSGSEGTPVPGSTPQFNGAVSTRVSQIVASNSGKPPLEDIKRKLYATLIGGLGIGAAAYITNQSGAGKSSLGKPETNVLTV